MEGQWGWFGGGVFAATGWLDKPILIDGGGGYWFQDVGASDLVHQTSPWDQALVWPQVAEQEHQQQCYWGLMHLPPPVKCGWNEQQPQAQAQVPSLLHTFPQHSFPNIQHCSASPSPQQHQQQQQQQLHFVVNNGDGEEEEEQESRFDVDEQQEDEFTALPDDLLEKIFAALPLLSLFRSRAVCRRWNSIIKSNSFRSMCAQVSSQKPWYLMYKDSDKMVGVAFDSSSRKWHNFVLPSLDPVSSFVASAGGLACFLDKTNCGVAYVCNPLTKAWRKLPNAPHGLISDYCAVSMSVSSNSSKNNNNNNNISSSSSSSSSSYKIVVARSTPATDDDYTQWSVSVQVYDSTKDSWNEPSYRLLQGWRAGEESVICNHIFYCVTHSTVGAAHDYSRHGLIAYDLVSECFVEMITQMPCSLSCVRLINCDSAVAANCGGDGGSSSSSSRLVMVGGIGTYDFIKGVGVWELSSSSSSSSSSPSSSSSSAAVGEWKQMSRMPTRLFHGFAGGLDDVFSCSGQSQVIYIHSYGSPQLLLFDIAQSSWTWAKACPVLKRDPLHLFTGFCFQPRLDISV